MDNLIDDSGFITLEMIQERDKRIAELEEFILGLDCEGYDWCGKSPMRENNYDGRCAICKKQSKLQEVE